MSKLEIFLSTVVLLTLNFAILFCLRGLPVARLLMLYDDVSDYDDTAAYTLDADKLNELQPLEEQEEDQEHLLSSTDQFIDDH